MNREIKFRSWIKKENRMFYDFTILNHPCNSEEKDSAGKECFLMQYTGLKDKNGKEIYEGDIVKYTFDLTGSLYATENGLKSRINKVFWSDWRSSFAVGNNSWNNNLFNYVRNGNRVEVIGNIYENPELLEKQH